MKKILYIALFLLSTVIAKSQVAGDYRSTDSVSLTTIVNWQTYVGGSWVAATVSPNAATLTTGNTIAILPSHKWYLFTAATIPEGVTLIFQGVAGNFTPNMLTINGTYIHATGPTTGTNSTASSVFNAVNTTTGLGANSTVIYRASASYTTPVAALGGRTYNNITFDNDGTAVTPSFASPGFTTPLTINGTLTVDTWRADFYNSTSTIAVNINGNINLTGANTYLRLRTATIAVGKTLTIGTTDSLGISAANVLTVNGTLINRSIKPIVVGTGGSIVVNGTLQHDANGGTIPNTTATYNASSTILVTGITNVSNIPVLPTTCANVVWNCTGQVASNTFINTSSNVTTINGNLTVQSTGTAYIYLGGAGTGRTLNVNGDLIVSGGKIGALRAPSNGATANQTCNVSGNVIISSGEFHVSDKGAASVGIGILNIGGSLTHTGGNFGSNGPTNGLVYFNTNNTDKTITTTGIDDSTSIVIEKSSTGAITLLSDLISASGGTLTLASGNLTIAAGKTLQLPNAAALIGGNATSYIALAKDASSTGMFSIKAIVTATLFPVGSTTNYLPVTLTPVSSSDFSVGVFEGVTNNGTVNGGVVTGAEKAKIVDAIWLINRTSANTDNCVVTLGWPTSLEGASFASYNNNIGVARYNAGWGTSGGTGDNTANIAANTFNAFSSFGVGELGVVLPVRFTNINAATHNNVNTITWKVENQININKYEVERSADAINFKSIATVEAKKHTTSVEYSYNDATPIIGTNFYRIKSFDLSGEIKYSGVAKISTTEKGRNELAVYPNPITNKTLNIQLKNIDKADYSMMIVNNIGQQIFSKQLGSIEGSQSLSIGLPVNMQVGIYHLVIKSNNQQIQQTIIIQ